VAHREQEPACLRTASIGGGARSCRCVRLSGDAIDRVSRSELYQRRDAAVVCRAGSRSYRDGVFIGSAVTWLPPEGRNGAARFGAMTRSGRTYPSSNDNRRIGGPILTTSKADERSFDLFFIRNWPEFPDQDPSGSSRRKMKDIQVRCCHRRRRRPRTKFRIRRPAGECHWIYRLTHWAKVRWPKTRACVMMPGGGLSLFSEAWGAQWI